MDLGLTGRSALVTGASRGIGRACAVSLAREGCDLHLVARTGADLDRVAAALRAAHGVQVRTHAADLSDADVARKVWDACGGVDILVNNAGAIPAGTIDAVDDGRWREAWDLKVFGYIALCRAALPAMAARGGGVILNVIGVGGERPTAGYVVGAAGNAALMALTRALGATSSRQGVRVLGINPGKIETERMVTLARTGAQARFGDPERWREMLDPEYPPGQPEHIGDLVAFLASDRSANTTGTIVTVDGGASARS